MERVALTTGDGSVRGTLCGLSEASSGAPLLVCIHGSGCTSAYFDLRGNSLVEAAALRAMPALLVDRPGHGASPAAAAGSSIAGSADAAIALIEAARATLPGLAAKPIAIIGHSFGGAVALVVGARMASAGAPPAAICVSGIGDQPDAQYGQAWQDMPAGTAAKPAPYWLFGPGRTYDWRGVTALRAAAAPWLREEVDELRQIWPGQWPAVTGAITSPVHFRLAEFERIWQATPAATARQAAAFLRSGRVDAAMAPDGGHLYETHLRGPELIAEQLDFIRAATMMRASGQLQPA